jgi:hypothetical protein
MGVNFERGGGKAKYFSGSDNLLGVKIPGQKLSEARTGSFRFCSDLSVFIHSPPPKTDSTQSSDTESCVK